jgi:hypothetical protein
MKWNWGKGIFIFYALFVIVLAIQLFRSFQYDRSLVVEDYYAKDLAYQEQFDRIQNVLKHNADVTIEHAADSLLIQFPEDHLSPEGAIHFYRADNKSLDQTYPIDLNEKGRQLFVSSEFAKGKWTIKISWQWDGNDYFVEQEWIAP